MRVYGVADVIHAVNFARTNDLLVSVRGGGHNVSGNAICDGAPRCAHNRGCSEIPLESIRISLGILRVSGWPQKGAEKGSFPYRPRQQSLHSGSLALRRPSRICSLSAGFRYCRKRAHLLAKPGPTRSHSSSATRASAN